MTGIDLRPYRVHVVGYGFEMYHAQSRAAALVKAWHFDAFSGLSYAGFLKIANARLMTAAPQVAA